MGLQVCMVWFVWIHASQTHTSWTHASRFHASRTLASFWSQVFGSRVSGSRVSRLRVSVVRPPGCVVLPSQDFCRCCGKKRLLYFAKNQHDRLTVYIAKNRIIINIFFVFIIVQTVEAVTSHFVKVPKFMHWMENTFALLV